MNIADMFRFRVGLHRARSREADRGRKASAERSPLLHPGSAFRLTPRRSKRPEPGRRPPSKSGPPWSRTHPWQISSATGGRREHLLQFAFSNIRMSPWLPPTVREAEAETCLLYTSDAADERSSVDLG